VVVVPLVVDVVVEPLVVVVVSRPARVVEVDDAEFDGVLEHAATVSATPTIEMATAARPMSRQRLTSAAYVATRSGALFRRRGQFARRRERIR
jgi:hypothetical protein